MPSEAGIRRSALTAVSAGFIGLMAWAVMPLAIGWHADVILTGSMAPGVRPGDVVVSAPVEPADVSPGQVILFRDPSDKDKLLTHRVVRRQDGGSFITKGDANAV